MNVLLEELKRLHELAEARVQMLGEKYRACKSGWTYERGELAGRYSENIMLCNEFIELKRKYGF